MRVNDKSTSTIKCMGIKIVEGKVTKQEQKIYLKKTGEPTKKNMFCTLKIT